MSIGMMITGFILGAVGGALHLGVTWWRASLLVSRGVVSVALLAYPLSLLGPAAAVLLAAKIAPAAAWMTPLGFFAARFVGLRAVAPRPHPPPGADTGGKA